jgi:acetyltransferase-like isoleucine patch superfamily enzyme
MLSHLKLIFRVPKILILAYMKHYKIQCCNPDSFISFPISLYYDNINSIQIGAGTTIDAFSEIVVEKHSSFSHIPGKLTIGERVAIGSHANIRAAGGEIYIGENTLIAQHVSLIAAGHIISQAGSYRDLPWDESKVGILIGKNVWIGANTIILPGCSIGDNSVIGAGSVVTKPVPSNEIWVGNPATKLRNVDVSNKFGLNTMKTSNV